MHTACYVWIGFAKDEMYGHISIAYVFTDTFEQMMKKINPKYQSLVHEYAVRGNAEHDIEGTFSYDKAEIVEALPEDQVEQMTITMVEWLLIVITAVIIGIFFYVINLQKEKEFGVLKAIGTGMGSLVKMI